MNHGILDHSASRIGQTWGEDDHLRLVMALRKIDDLVRALHAHMQPASGAAKQEKAEVTTR